MYQHSRIIPLQLSLRLSGKIELYIIMIRSYLDLIGRILSNKSLTFNVDFISTCCINILSKLYSLIFLYLHICILCSLTDRPTRTKYTNMNKLKKIVLYLINSSRENNISPILQNENKTIWN